MFRSLENCFFSFMWMKMYCVISISWLNFNSIFFTEQREKHKKGTHIQPTLNVMHMYVCTPNTNVQIQFIDIVTKSVKLFIIADWSLYNKQLWFCVRRWCFSFSWLWNTATIKPANPQQLIKIVSFNSFVVICIRMFVCFWYRYCKFLFNRHRMCK